jgi:hypothetical protein
MAHRAHDTRIDWLKANLFSSWGNTVLTLIALAIIWIVVTRFLEWALFSAVFSGDDGAACNQPGAGACWPFITGCSCTAAIRTRSAGASN